MRQKIIETIKTVGLNTDEFKIGYGGTGFSSEIHYNCHGYDQHNDQGKNTPFSSLEKLWLSGRLGNESIRVLT